MTSASEEYWFRVLEAFFRQQERHRRTQYLLHRSSRKSIQKMQVALCAHDNWFNACKKVVIGCIFVDGQVVQFVPNESIDGTGLVDATVCDMSDPASLGSLWGVVERTRVLWEAKHPTGMPQPVPHGSCMGLTGRVLCDTRFCADRDRLP